MTEDNYTFDIQRPVSVFMIAFIINAKGNFVVFFYRIELVTDLSAVKIYFVIFLVEVKIYGKGIRVAENRRTNGKSVRILQGADILNMKKRGGHIRV